MERCFACGGPYHEATGHFFREWGIVYCGACYRHFITEFLKPQLRRRCGSKNGDFYEHAATSVGAQCLAVSANGRPFGVGT